MDSEVETEHTESSGNFRGGLSELWDISPSIEGNYIKRLEVSSSDSFTITEHGGEKRLTTATMSCGVVGAEQETSDLLYHLEEQSDSVNGKWLGHTNVLPSDVLSSLSGTFSFAQEDEHNKGLRLPQIGAVHAVMGHLTASLEPATVVMPTGTGKTETMLSLFCAIKPKCLLVVVPTDALRDQIAKKFEILGVLQEFGIIQPTVLRPFVGKIKHGFDTDLGAKGFVEGSNVIVTTPNALLQSPEEVWKTLLRNCSHMFIDEAHHIGAKTWRQIRDEFTGKPVVQFTATPYRNDGINIGGRLIYNFPLKKAQQQGYFCKIKYIGVVDFEDADRAIASRAIECLREDLANDLNHLVMARAKTVDRAKQLIAIYEELAPDLKPVIVYNKLSPEQRRDAFRALESRESRIVVCVDMMGEGFDMPSLKIAAIHDPHKTLGITLQFIGRFARVGNSSLGEATAIVNRSDPQHDKRLRELYAENTDWNYIIQDLSAEAVGEQEELGFFSDGFGGSLPDEVSLQNLSPKMSAVVYKTQTTEWHPERLKDHFKERLVTNPLPINTNENIVWLVAKTVSTVRWGEVKTLENVDYGFLALYWDRSKQLLYINSSSNDGVYEDIAKKVCGENVELYRGTNVYRTLAAVSRRVPTNIGLKDIRDKSFQLIVSPNTDEALTTADRSTKTQTNIFASGFDDKSGERINMGASVKGRIWTRRSALSLKQWMEWCDYVGAKLKDNTIDVQEVMAGFIIPEAVESRPELIPLALEWPSDAFLNTSENIQLKIDGEYCSLVDAELTITVFNDSGAIPFNVSTPSGKIASYELTIEQGKMNFRATQNPAEVVANRTSMTFAEYLQNQGLRVIFEQEITLEPDMLLYKPKEALPTFDAHKLQVIDWTGIDIHKESQGQERDQSSIQARAANYIEGLNNWDVIIDDDGSGEMADIVAMKIDGKRLLVNLVHCKFSHGDRPGSRVVDLYEVCGQAQKSVSRRRKYELFIANLIRREKKRQKDGKNGILKGSAQDLQKIADQAAYLMPKFAITIVQPGVSKAAVSDSQLEILGATESYIKHTGGGTPLDVIVSA